MICTYISLAAIWGLTAINKSLVAGWKHASCLCYSMGARWFLRLLGPKLELPSSERLQSLFKMSMRWTVECRTCCRSSCLSVRALWRRPFPSSRRRPRHPTHWSVHTATPSRESRGGPMVSTQVRQSERSGFKSRSGQIAYFHGVKTRLSTLGTGDVPRGSDST